MLAAGRATLASLHALATTGWERGLPGHIIGRSSRRTHMHFRSILLLIVVALTAAFAALNWTAFTTPTALWVGFTTVQAPIGVIMLSLTAFLCVLFVAWVIYLQGTVIIESRRQARELNAQRDLADKAEASRFTELRSFMSAELLRVT